MISGRKCENWKFLGTRIKKREIIFQFSIQRQCLKLLETAGGLGRETLLTKVKGNSWMKANVVSNKRLSR